MNMLEQVCGYLNNYFVVKPDGRHVGCFKIENGQIDCGFLTEGQYFRVVGSVFNDGIYQYPTAELMDEKFGGEIWAMAVPPSVIAILNEIEDWDAKFGSMSSPNMSPFQSESFNNYSYSKGSKSTGSGSVSGAPTTWMDVFAPKLRRWKKL